MANSPLQTKTAFVVRWTGSYIIGWLLGILLLLMTLMIWQVLANTIWNSFREEKWYELWQAWLRDAVIILFFLATSLLMGALLGWIQWEIALRDKVNKWGWILSCSFVFTIGFVGLLIAYRAAPPMFVVHYGGSSGFGDYLTLSDTWAISVIVAGTTFGFSAGLPQWFVLRQHFYGTIFWLLGVLVGGITVFAAIVGIVLLVKSTVMSWMFGCCFSPIVFGSVTGIALYSLLKRPKHQIS